MAEAREPDLEDVKARIQAWLQGEGWKLSAGSHPDADWLIVAEDSARRRLVVGQARQPSDQIRIQAAVDLAPDHRTKFATLPARVRGMVLWDLRFRLLELNVEFKGLGEPLERVTVTQRIYLDGLTKDRFLQRVGVTKNALIMVIWTVLRNLGDAAPPTSHGEPLVH